MVEPLHSLIQEMIPTVEQEMKVVFRVDDKPGDPFYGMMHYHMGWSDQGFRPIVSLAGKRIRPLLCLLSTMAAGGNWHTAVPGAASLEMVHNFTLVHDDIQDSSPTRRGRPTVWRIWGENQAINSGDAMFALSHMAMTRMVELGVSAQIVVSAIRRLDETCVDLTIGQYSDMFFEERGDVTVDQYINMIDGKTAALLSFCSELGALIAGCDKERLNHYAAFGRDLGLAFQVRDDILGIWGDEEVIGKSAATDIAKRKKSLPVLFGLAESETIRSLYNLDRSDEAFVKQVVGALDAAGARNYAEAQEQLYAQSALDHLTAAKPQGIGAEALHQLTNRLLDRET